MVDKEIIVKFYKNEEIKTEEEFIFFLEAIKKEIEEHSRTVDIPAPLIDPELTYAIEEGIDITFVNMTEDEENEFELKKLEGKRVQDFEEEKEKREQAKLEAQQNPSEEYGEFRAEEFPDLGKQIGTLLKQVEKLTNQKNTHPDFKEILEEVATIKKKYPKP